eukprot:5556766-Amphidinium_carterae.2
MLQFGCNWNAGNRCSVQWSEATTGFTSVHIHKSNNVRVVYGQREHLREGNHDHRNLATAHLRTLRVCHVNMSSQSLFGRAEGVLIAYGREPEALYRKLARRLLAMRNIHVSIEALT